MNSNVLGELEVHKPFDQGRVLRVSIGVNDLLSANSANNTVLEQGAKDGGYKEFVSRDNFWDNMVEQNGPNEINAARRIAFR